MDDDEPELAPFVEVELPVCMALSVLLPVVAADPAAEEVALEAPELRSLAADEAAEERLLASEETLLAPDSAADEALLTPDEAADEADSAAPLAALDAELAAEETLELASKAALVAEETALVAEEMPPAAPPAAALEAAEVADAALDAAPPSEVVVAAACPLVAEALEDGAVKLDPTERRACAQTCSPIVSPFVTSLGLGQFCSMQTWYALNQVGVAQSPARSEFATPGARNGASAILIWKQLRAHRGAESGSCACVSGITAAKSGRRTAAVGNMVGRSCGKSHDEPSLERKACALPWGAHEDE